MSAVENTDLNEPLSWPAGGVTRVPYRIYADPEIYALEQQKLFRGPAWHFLCLEIEVAEPGDFRTSFVGEIPVVVTRDQDAAIHAMVNRCAHKGALVCLAERGNCQTLACIYHSWTYDLAGRLKAVAFQNGVRGQGGMPADFDIGQHRMEALRVEVYCGLVFATFSQTVAPLQDYLGPAMRRNIERNFSRPLKLLGFHSQILHNNWKLYAENIRDSYHASLLHTFYTTFKVNRFDMDGGIVLSDDGFHHFSYAKRDTLEAVDDYDAVHAGRYESALAAPELLESRTEVDDGVTHSIQSIFPTLGLQCTLNSLAVRFFVPRGVDKTELFWRFVGYADDDDEMTRLRVMQSNLTGAAGYVSLEDGCINELVQRGTRGSGSEAAFMEMGGREVAASEASRATETALRGFWQAYRGVMGL